MKNEFKVRLESIDNIIEFLQTIQKSNGLAQIKKLNFECWIPNKIKNFDVEYFSPEDFPNLNIK